MCRAVPPADGHPDSSHRRLSQPNLRVGQHECGEQDLLRDLWQDDAFRDFDSVYKSMVVGERAESVSGVLGVARDNLDSLSSLQMSPPADDSTYGKLAANGSSPMCDLQVSPSVSLAASSEQTRADSRNTNGPALVEEMTLSDLEEEISSSLFAAKEASARASYLSDSDRQSIRARRSRQPLPLSLAELARQPQLRTSATSGYQSDHSRPNEGRYTYHHQHHYN